MDGVPLISMYRALYAENTLCYTQNELELVNVSLMIRSDLSCYQIR